MKNNTGNIMRILIAISFTIFLAWLAYLPEDEGGRLDREESKAYHTPAYTLVDMNVSAYCPCEKCCGNFADDITASGKPATGKLIAAPRNYAFGTVMDVPGYGIAEVQDRGGAIKGNKLDLLFPTHQEALNWGRHENLAVKVYK